MARAEHRFVCRHCGAEHAKWAGRCDGCGEWNALAPSDAPKTVPKGLKAGQGQTIELVSLASAKASPDRLATGIAELDRVLGGGLVTGSAVLIGGDPGIGKSTIVLQAASALAARGLSVAYVSGEESVDQIQLRARRLGLLGAPLQLAAATSIGDIVQTFDKGAAPDLLVIDSIQTMFVDNIDSAPGTVTQLRTSTHELIRFAKRRGTALFLVGHVTKDGQIAGPKLLEHMVDAVLYFEGERGLQFRILRAVKNRFGAANEIGVFEMAEDGLIEVPNPSSLFLEDRDAQISGAAVFAGMEGSRPLLVEIQALVGSSPPGSPRRTIVGWDSARLAMLLAVLEARCGLAMGDRDVYLNVAGGLRIAEPGADLAVAAALISSLLDRPVPEATVFFGEIGLAGEVRAVGHMQTRIKEAQKLGFRRVVLPEARRRSDRQSETNHLQKRHVKRLSQLVEVFGETDARQWVE
ncbi:MAG: DNA repair protein RadA [Rhizobiales bacterium]|nr:DNA repair protein RadA [Hyphomicrobiales bacterium]